MSNQDKKDIMKEIDSITRLYNLNEGKEKKEKKGDREITLERELDSITKLYNLE